MTASKRRVVAIAGASGFIGKRIAEGLAGSWDFVGLSRRDPGAGFSAWRPCDLFSFEQTLAALGGCDLLIYLVHSMEPNVYFAQGSFADFDLLCADNAARAAAARGIAQIVYIGGIVPNDAHLSPHLTSRLEVERALAAYGTPVTTLRAGMVIGAGGSSFEIMRRLVERLPLLLVPRWTQTLSQPIAIDDLLKLVAFVLGNPDAYGQRYDVAGPQALSYAELMRQCAQLLHLRRRFVAIPWLTPRLSTLWVAGVSRAPQKLIGPLVESLKHSMVTDDHRLLGKAGIQAMNAMQAMQAALATSEATRPTSIRRNRTPAASGTTSSVQRLPLPAGRDARWLAEIYLHWLASLPGLQVRQPDEHQHDIFFLGLARPVLSLAIDPSSADASRCLIQVKGGLLASRPATGTLEFRTTLDGRVVIASLQHYAPRLPWRVYRATQAPVHSWVMHRFARHLQRMASRLAPGP